MPSWEIPNDSSSNLPKTAPGNTVIYPELSYVYRDFLPPFQTQKTKMQRHKSPASREIQKPGFWYSMISRGVYQELMNKELRLSQNFEKLSLSILSLQTMSSKPYLTDVDEILVGHDTLRKRVTGGSVITARISWAVGLGHNVSILSRI
jgi:hypothetical protein